MARSDRDGRFRVPRTWQCALVGGLASVPLTLGLDWLSDSGDEFSSSMVVVGGLLAGYLASRRSVNPGRAGLGAGVVGGVPGFLWVLPAMVGTAGDFADVASFPPLVVLFVATFSLVVVALHAGVGLLGGVAGGWLGTVLRRGGTAAVGN